MHLHAAPASPYTRKVKIAARLLNLSDRIEDLPTNTNDPDGPLRSRNPLGKIPTLVLADGSALYDSRVILDYFDHLAGGGRLFPLDAGARLKAMRQQALADGICDAAVLIVYEGRYRGETERSESWVSMQQGKIDRALDALEAEIGSYEPSRMTGGDVAIACALGYLDLRLDGAWRATHPKLVAWLDAFSAAHPVFEETRVKA